MWRVQAGVGSRNWCGIAWLGLLLHVLCVYRDMVISVYNTGVSLRCPSFEVCVGSGEQAKESNVKIAPNIRTRMYAIGKPTQKKYLHSGT